MTEGYVDILVTGLTDRQHIFALYIHIATTTRRAVLAAHFNSSGLHGSEDYIRTQSEVSLDANEIFVGI